MLLTLKLTFWQKCILSTTRIHLIITRVSSAEWVDLWVLLYDRHSAVLLPVVASQASWLYAAQNRWRCLMPSSHRRRRRVASAVWTDCICDNSRLLPTENLKTGHAQNIEDSLVGSRHRFTPRATATKSSSFVASALLDKTLSQPITSQLVTFRSLLDVYSIAISCEAVSRRRNLPAGHASAPWRLVTTVYSTALIAGLFQHVAFLSQSAR